MGGGGGKGGGKLPYEKVRDAYQKIELTPKGYQPWCGVSFIFDPLQLPQIGNDSIALAINYFFHCTLKDALTDENSGVSSRTS